VDYLIGSPITSITLAQEALKIGSYQMIQRNIEKLEKLGIVREVTGNKRNRVYQAVEILKILEDRM
jgi:Fic family protein